MDLSRRYALGGILAVFVCLAYACAVDSGEGRTGFEGDAGKDAARDGARAIVPDEDSGQPEDDSGLTCTSKVVVNELMTQGTAANDEFVELYNPGPCAIPMGGWKLAYRSATGNPSAPLFDFVVGTQISSKSFFLLGGDGFKGKIDGALGGAGLAATAGQVALLDDTGKVVDGVAYGAVQVTSDAGTFAEKAPADAPDTSGSIARKKDGVDTDDNSADFVKASPPTPGAANQ